MLTTTGNSESGELLQILDALVSAEVLSPITLTAEQTEQMEISKVNALS